MGLIARAQWLIRRSPMSQWRRTLGELVEQGEAEVGWHAQSQSVADGDLRHAAAWARRVERASKRFPTEPKCLPQAMALQWLLAKSEYPSILMIAMQRDDNAADDAREHDFHAWVELGGHMLIGAVDRSHYRPVLSFAHPPSGAL